MKIEVKIKGIIFRAPGRKEQRKVIIRCGKKLMSVKIKTTNIIFSRLCLSLLLLLGRLLDYWGD